MTTLPKLADPPATILEYLDERFPRVGHALWRSRFARGLVVDETGAELDSDAPYRVGLRVHYFREVEHEPTVPFVEEILFRNQRLLVVEKPHFLPVTPSGPYVNECLLYRLQRSTGLEHLTPLHRLDRPAAGLVLFSVDPETRGRYHRIFDEHRLFREYRAVVTAETAPSDHEWRIENRLVRGEPWFRMREVPGTPQRGDSDRPRRTRRPRGKSPPVPRERQKTPTASASRRTRHADPRRPPLPRATSRDRARLSQPFALAGAPPELPGSHQRRRAGLSDAARLALKPQVLKPPVVKPARSWRNKEKAAECVPSLSGLEEESRRKTSGKLMVLSTLLGRRSSCLSDYFFADPPGTDEARATFFENFFERVSGRRKTRSGSRL